jgi:hypothetical protein
MWPELTVLIQIHFKSTYKEHIKDSKTHWRKSGNEMNRTDRLALHDKCGLWTKLHINLYLQTITKYLLLNNILDLVSILGHIFITQTLSMWWNMPCLQETPDINEQPQLWILAFTAFTMQWHHWVWNMAGWFIITNSVTWARKWSGEFEEWCVTELHENMQKVLQQLELLNFWSLFIL